MKWIINLLRELFGPGCTRDCEQGRRCDCGRPKE